MINKAWHSIEDVRYSLFCEVIHQISRSHRLKNGQSNMRLLGRSQLSNPSDLPCFHLKFEAHTEAITEYLIWFVKTDYVRNVCSSLILQWYWLWNNWTSCTMVYYASTSIKTETKLIPFCWETFSYFFFFFFIDDCCIKIQISLDFLPKDPINNRPLTHWGHVTQICASNLGHHWCRKRLLIWSAPSHYLNQCWTIVNWTLKRKGQ